MRDWIQTTPSNIFRAGPSTQQHKQKLSRYRQEMRKSKEDFEHAIFLQEQINSLMNVIEELRCNQGRQ